VQVSDGSAPHGADGMRSARVSRARTIAAAGGIAAAVSSGGLPRRVDLTLAEALVLGLLRQDVRRFVTVLGHGSTELGEVLRVYQGAGLLTTHPVRHETEAAHAATALRWVTGQKAAVVTSIGPGALQAMAGSLVAASDGVGVWHLYGDETTQDEGPNMQQIPRAEQGLFLRLASTMGAAYSLHTPAALPAALARGLATVDHPYRPGPFFLLLPLNTQPQVIGGFNLDELPFGAPPRMGAAAPSEGYPAVARTLLGPRRTVIKVGGGARGCGPELLELADQIDAVLVTSPVSVGVVPSSHPRVMSVGGSKGSLSGNFAMGEADSLVVVGSRAVCQADCSRTGYPLVEHVVNINAGLDDVLHYRRTTALLGDARETLRELNGALASEGGATADRPESAWLRECRAARQRWEAHKQQRLDHPVIFDPVWGREVLTAPAAIVATTAAARAAGAKVFFDAGDVQAVGFQLADDEVEGQTYTDAGASYMGFAASAVLATALSDEPWYAVAISGDGSFTMNPQVLIDGAAHGATGCIVVLDNRRMGAISSLQREQYGIDHATSDGVAVDYAAWAGSVDGVLGLHGGGDLASLRAALTTAFAYPGLSLVHVPVYFGDDELGGLGSYGRWNVGSWVAATQHLRHEIGL
jgi:3D-(3,5/4)-trihydroxycyclohexane-1,2-dione acylhydrolase (decyclizing)